MALFFCRAQRLKCANADWPDRYGHYREAKFTQTKHHWWWKANRIFDQLRVTRNIDGKCHATSIIWGNNCLDEQNFLHLKSMIWDCLSILSLVNYKSFGCQFCEKLKTYYLLANLKCHYEFVMHQCTSAYCISRKSKPCITISIILFWIQQIHLVIYWWWLM